MKKEKHLSPIMYQTTEDTGNLEVSITDAHSVFHGAGHPVEETDIIRGEHINHDTMKSAIAPLCWFCISSLHSLFYEQKHLLFL